MEKKENELKDIKELMDDIPAALLYEEKKSQSKWYLVSNYGSEYKFSNKEPDTSIHGIGSAFITNRTSISGSVTITPELVLDLTINLNEDMAFDRCFLSVSEKYDTNGIYIQGGLDNKNHLNLHSHDSESLKEFGSLIYHNYIYPSLLSKQRDLTRLVNQISPSYMRSKKIGGLLDDDETND